MSRAQLRAMASFFTVNAVASIMRDIGAVVMPLKGALLLATTRKSDPTRTVSDVDLLVREGDFLRAQDAMLCAGFTKVASDRDERSATFSGSVPCPIDLHRALFQDGLFRMPTDELFERSTVDSTLFAVPVARMDPYDVYAHLVGHAVKSGLASGHPSFDQTRADLLSLSATLNAAKLASHLQVCGLMRSARYVLAGATDHFSREVLAALPEDTVAKVLTRIAPELFRSSSATRVLATHAFSDSTREGVRSLALHVRNGLAARLRS